MDLYHQLQASTHSPNASLHGLGGLGHEYILHAAGPAASTIASTDFPFMDGAREREEPELIKYVVGDHKPLLLVKRIGECTNTSLVKLRSERKGMDEDSFVYSLNFSIIQTGESKSVDDQSKSEKSIKQFAVFR
ncbi:hypothetical protein DMN91_002995 [Ooceraea biroi]|uniref:Uncharacterized protein n=1 Tax=Ooceraea biroi TaxID=2015173 RepID=A0A3L8DWQ3_OOCBI|nr:hypothetical protein DMN91_002995 [Ooceraea biroi]